ncbi:MAG: hypothetical protein EAZ97_13250 [Bacteroidetes bacterium]|nr:MAG: hypothetical protein EAZ97_13250 [Bacteroidota bacterium]
MTYIKTDQKIGFIILLLASVFAISITGLFLYLASESEEENVQVYEKKALNLLEVGTKTPLSSEDIDLLKNLEVDQNLSNWIAVAITFLINLFCIYLYSSGRDTRLLIVSLLLFVIFVFLFYQAMYQDYYQKGIDKGEKIVWEGKLTNKNSYKQNSKSSSRNYYFNFEGSEISVSRKDYEKFEIGQTLILHSLAEEEIIFKIELKTL